MADEKVNVSPEESKTPEAPAPSGPGDPPAPEHTEEPAVPGGDQAAPSHAEPAAGEHTQQTVLPGMGEDAPAPSGKVINLSDIQAADKGGKEASAPAPEKKAPEADKPPKRRGRPPKEQAGPTVEKKSKAAEPRTGRPSKVDKAAREEAPPSVRDKVSRSSAGLGSSPTSIFTGLRPVEISECDHTRIACQNAHPATRHEKTEALTPEPPFLWLS